MMQNLIFDILFSKILFRGYIFLYSPARSSGHNQILLLVSDFRAESLKAKKNQWKRSLILQYSFDQKISLILRTSTPEPQLLTLQIF